MSKLKVFLLGSPQLEIDGTPIELERRKAMALLAYLAVTDKSHSRDTLATLLWPEADQNRARTTLRHNLWTMNKALGDGWLDISRETINLVTKPELWVDVNQFRYELAACQTHDHTPAAVCPDCLPHLREAVSLFQDDFLAGFTLRDSPEFDDWQRFESEALHRELREALERLVRGQSAREDFKAAIPYAQRWAALDPLHEPAHRHLMELYARAGQRAAALHQYAECERILHQELGVPPSMETTALAERIRLETDGQQGQLIKSYELQELIGAGGFGEVYKAYQPQVRREVAIKAILPQYANQPDFIRRFEAEAHMVAQLEHPHIVPLYDYWREPDGAYLVMRWLRGGSLEDALKDGPWSPEATTQLLDQIAAALMLAHQRGIIHRDLKPANILLDEGGNGYLTDFGIAKAVTAPRSASQTQAGVVLGSPAYMAPEAANDEPLTSQTDIYSLGVMLFEILTGHHPFPDTTPPMMLVKHLSEPLPPLELPNPDLSTALNEVIQRATAKKPADRYADAISLAADFRQALGSEQVSVTALPDESTPLLVPNPYKGLRAFQESDAADFFGRDTLVDQLLVRLMLNKPTTRRSPLAQSPMENLQNFLAVVGPSGSGKSSLVKAGLIPALRQNAIPGSKNWFTVEMTPGSHPLEELEAALLRIAINPPPTLLDQLRADERGLLRAVKRILPDGETDSDRVELLLFIDQFEEVFTLVEDEARRSHFLDSLHTAVTEPDSRLRVVITLRADFYDRPLLYEGFGDLLRQRMETVLPLSSNELEQAIAGPAERVGATLETGLVPLIIADVQEQPGTLPLMQYALTELFEQRQGRLLTIEAYQASGGVMGALARRADELYTELDDAGRATTRRLFLRLVTLGEGVENTRRRVLHSELSQLSVVSGQSSASSKGAREQGSRGEIQNPKSKIQNVIDQFGHYRLLTFDRDPVTRGPTVEVAHEALIREWGRLRRWLDDDREFLFWQQRLRAGLHQWRTSDYDEGALLRGAPLAEAENWLNQRRGDLNETEREFLQASLALRERQAAEREAQLRRELEVAQELADSEKRRAEDQAQAATSLRKRAVWLAGVGVIAVLLALAAGLFGVKSSQNAEQAGQAQQTAEARRIEAETAQQEAERQARQVRAAQLVAEVKTVLDRREDLSGALPLLLGREAVLTTLIPDGYFTLDAEAALRLAIDQAPLLPVITLPANKGDVPWAAFSPDGRTVVTTACRDKFICPEGDLAVRLWDVATGHEIRRFEGHTETSYSAVFSPDGQTLVTASNDTTVLLWDVATGQEIRRLTGHTAPVHRAIFSQDGQTILTASWDGTAGLWEAATGREIRRFRGHSDRVYSAAFSPDEKTIVTGSGDNTARLWETATGQEIRRWIGDVGSDVRSVAFSPDGKTIVTVSYDATTRNATAHLWDVETGREIYRLEGVDHDNCINSVAFSPDGRQIVTGGEHGMVRLWDVESGAEIRRLAGPAGCIFSTAFSPDGRMVVASSEDGTARLWDLGAGTIMPRLEGHTTSVNAAAFSADGQTIVTAGGSRLGGDNTIRLWDVATRREIRRFEGHTGPVNSVAISPDDQTIVTASDDQTARLWDVKSGVETQRFEGHTDKVNSAAFSPDGQTIITASDDRTARLWDTATGQEIGRFEGHTKEVTSAAFSPDGNFIVTASGDHTACLWQVTTELKLTCFEGHTKAVNLAVFSPDGQTIVTASEDQTTRLWDAATGQEIRRFEGHAAPVNSAIFSPDGQTIVTAGFDQTARVWDVATGQEIRRLDGHTGPVNWAAFSPDGESIVTASADNTARVWPSVETLLEAAESLIQRDPPEFTPEERIRFGLATE